MGLDLVRFVAAIAVLFWHYQNLWYTPHGLVGFVREQQPLYRYFRIFYDFGLYGVQVFWSISGYIFFWKYRESIVDRSMGGKWFFVLRFSRLYPLHLATLLLVAALQMTYVHLKGFSFVYGQNDPYHFVLQLFLASNWGFQVASSFNGPIWSISLEILVYVAFFVVLRYLGSSLLWNFAIIVAAGAAHALLGHNPIFQCFVCFYVGGLAAALSSLPAARRHDALLLKLSLGLLFALPVAAALLGASLRKPFAPLFLLCYVPVFLYVMAEHCRIPQRYWGAVQAAGNMTYSSYLVHFPLQLAIAVFCTALGVSIPRLNPAFFVAYMMTVLVLAWLIFRFFEMPCQEIIRRKLAPLNMAP